jgi:hypothetical protein
MNRIFLSLFVVLAVSVVSCKDDEEKPSYSFKDQDAQGKIANESWTYVDGYATADQFFVINLTLEEAETGCAISVAEKDHVAFIAEFDTRVYQLGTGSTVYTVTLIEMDGPVNHISTEGAIEITEVTDTHVSGRLDARVDGENYINGNFTVPICK